jgi:hypothetical protein
VAILPHPDDCFHHPFHPKNILRRYPMPSIKTLLHALCCYIPPVPVMQGMHAATYRAGKGLDANTIGYWDAEAEASGPRISMSLVSDNLEHFSRLPEVKLVRY